MSAATQPTLKHLHESTLRRYATAPAITFGDETISYATLDEQSACLANALLNCGLCQEDRVGLLMSNRPEYVIADIALSRAGLAKVPLNDMLGPEDIEYMLDNSDANAVIAGPNFVETVLDIAPNVASLDHIVAIESEESTAIAECRQFETLLDEGDASSPAVSVSPDTLAGVFHTGGTTGDPKGVKHTQENLALNAYAHAIELNIQTRDNLLLMTPLPHSAGLIMAGGLTQGGHHVISQGFDAERALEAVEQQAISWTFMVPTMVYRVLDTLDERSFDTSTLETLVYGAAPMKPDRLREGLDKLGDIFVQLYGQYETPDLITVLPKAAHDPANEQRLSSCGLPTAMCEVRVVDDDGNEVPPGQPGEILAHAAYSMDGYYEMPKKTAETIEDGWIRTGDIGKRDEDGYLYIIDRESDVIISGGMNVYSVAVEDIVQQHDHVANVAVIGVPDDEWGEVVTAVVVPSGETIDREAIRSFSAERLADYEVPKRIETINELPTTPYGKVDKKRLRKPYWESESREVS